MFIDIDFRKNGEFVVILPRRELDWPAWSEFHRKCSEFRAGRKYFFDLDGHETVPGPGIAMLLLFRQWVGNQEADITLLNCSDGVRFALARYPYWRFAKVPKRMAFPAPRDSAIAQPQTPLTPGFDNPPLLPEPMFDWARRALSLGLSGSEDLAS